MRQALGVFSALVLSFVSVNVCLAADSSVLSASEEIELAESAFGERRIEAGLIALQRAANLGSLKALLRIAEIHDAGKLVPQDRLKACQTYSSAADRYAKVDRYYPAVDLVAKAFRQSALCYVKGLEALGWERNMSVAADLYFHAGVILQDPESLFELAKLYLSGEGIAQNTAMAIHLLDNAARKQYPPAQALLGSMMWEGKVMKRRAAPGLALLMLGKERTASENRAWISSLYDDAIITAPKEVEEEALLLVEKWKSVHGDTIQTAATVGQRSDVPAPAKSPTRQFEGLPVDFANGTDRFQNQTTNIHVPPAVADQK